MQVESRELHHLSRASDPYGEVYLEVDDAQLFAEGEEVTLVRWGNFFIDRIVKDENGTVISLEVTSLHDLFPPSFLPQPYCFS